MGPPTRRVGPADRRADSRNASSTAYQSDLPEDSAQVVEGEAIIEVARLLRAGAAVAEHVVAHETDAAEGLRHVVVLLGRVHRLLAAPALSDRRVA